MEPNSIQKIKQELEGQIELTSRERILLEKITNLEWEMNAIVREASNINKGVLSQMSIDIPKGFCKNCGKKI